MQVWQHRRQVVEWLDEGGEAELRFCKIILSADEKNYHAWQHRQWAVEKFKWVTVDLVKYHREFIFHVTLFHFSLYDGELPFVEELLDTDVRNNSAWNQRFFVVSHEVGDAMGEDVLQRELDFVEEKIKIVPSNESAWNYLRG